jgi:hypothetical protein
LPAIPEIRPDKNPNGVPSYQPRASESESDTLGNAPFKKHPSPLIITRHEKPVARLIPEGGRSRAEIQRAAEGLEALQQEIAAFCTGKPGLSWKEFKTFVEEGRR